MADTVKAITTFLEGVTAKINPFSTTARSLLILRVTLERHAALVRREQIGRDEWLDSSENFKRRLSESGVLVVFDLIKQDPPTNQNKPQSEEEKPTVVLDNKRRWYLTLDELGLQETAQPENAPELALSKPVPVDITSKLSLPVQLQEGLRTSLALLNPEGDLPLWLNLVRPYGILGACPWEDVLGNAISRQVLRLPDFLERPRENTDVLECAVVFDPGPTEDPDKCRAQLRYIVDQIIAASSSRLQTRINIFTTAAWHAKLGPISQDSRVQQHSPDHAAQLAEELRKAFGETGSGATGPALWLDWIDAATGNRTIDAIYFVGRAVASEERAGLLISSSPVGDEETNYPALIEIDAIGATFTRLGSWAAIFSPTPGATDKQALAFVADAFARSRPCVALCQTADPKSGKSLYESLSFLFSVNASPPAKLVDAFIYCQPQTVAGYSSFRSNITLDDLTQSSELLGSTLGWIGRARATASAYTSFLSTPNITQAPNWASAIQRYIEIAALEELRRNSTDVLFTKTDALTGKVASAAQSETLKNTLSDIQKIVGRHVQKLDKN